MTKETTTTNTERVTYFELARRVGDMVLNNYVRQQSEDFESWELQSGKDQYCYKHDTEEECTEHSEDCDYEYTDIYQDYIITSSGADYLERNTDEIVYYNEKLDMYVWSITHYGTSWDYVHTDIKK